ncbi:sodium-coupled monocarboxylate transporter 1 [Rhipicephalus sanguineus]|uniref:sodium-coupled monocarboxylate transporter 1 n=1 Tax=Rhipicephalus sanguineus TaxID=34632 RepID=UPI00189554DB|nr:sodium-coupled monocarboxylate transporter 1 [Rhipicephalus sanguineus]
MNVIEYILFGVLVLANFCLGLYFSFKKRRQPAGSSSAAMEVFLGGRRLMMLPLAASTVASVYTSTGLVGFPSHFYAYGWHLFWGCTMPLFIFPLATHVFVPVLYGLGITSIFEYIRRRFNSAISLTACAIYIFFTQSIGAISIYAASLVLETVFHLPLLWCNIVIGLSGTVYTALGGLRGVVWTDCVQFVIIICAPAAIVTKVIIDSTAPDSTVRPLRDLEIGDYIAKYRLDFTSEENMWSCFFGSAAPAMFRLCFDQVVTQRLLASRTQRDAKRTVVTGSVLLVCVYTTMLSMGVALTTWFRGCDPLLSGAVDRVDQILPHYINTRLVQVPGFVGLYLAGVVCAATSTTSSTINSQAAILYVDVITPCWKNATRHVLWITRCTALALGVIMTVYSTLCVHMGSLTRVFVMVFSCLTSPYVGLCVLAILFPFVHSKGVGVATVVTITFQLWHVANSIKNHTTPPRMPQSLDYCPVNTSFRVSVSDGVNHTSSFEAPRSEESLYLFRISYLWISFFGIFITIAIGVLVSALTGEMWSKEEQPELSSDLLVRIWRKRTHNRDESQLQAMKTSKNDGHGGGTEDQDLLNLGAHSHV